MASAAEGWEVTLVPPLNALPTVTFARDDEDVLVPTPEGVQALDVLVWALERMDTPVLLRGTAEERALVLERLQARGLSAQIEDGPPGVRASWVLPGG